MHYNLALALEQTGDYDAERASLDQAIQLRPNFAEAENQLGVILARAHEDAKAEQHFRSAIAIAPSYAEAANNLGTLLGDQGRDHEAEGFFRAAVKTNPRYLQAWINLAATLASEAEFGNAQSAVDTALRIDAQNAEALRLRAMLANETPNQSDRSNPNATTAPTDSHHN